MRDAKDIAEDLIKASLNARNNDAIIVRAKKSDDYFWGDQPARNRQKSMGNLVYNKFGEALENRLARFVERKPKFDYKPGSFIPPAVSSALDKIVGDVLWERFNDEAEGDFAEDEVVECMSSGSVHTKFGIDDDGFPIMQHLPCEQILYDPPARNFKESRYIGFMFKKPLEEINRKYKKNLQKMTEMPSLADAGTNKSDYALNDRMGDVWAQMSSSVRRGKFVSEDVLPSAILVELWMDDPTLENIPFDETEITSEHEMLSVGQMPKVTEDQYHKKHLMAHREEMLRSTDTAFQIALQAHIEMHEKYPEELLEATKKLKYPNGRQIIISQGEILKDQPFPLGTYWKNMVVKWDWLKTRNNYWGKPFGHDLFDRQDAINHRKNSITANTNLNNMGIRKWKKGSTKDTSKMSNLIGQNVFLNDPDRDLRVDYGQPIPNQYFTELQLDLLGFDQQANTVAPLSGQLPAAGTANVTLENLITQGEIRGGLPLKHYIQSLKKKAKALIHLLVEFQPDITVEINGQPVTVKQLSQIPNLLDVPVSVRVEQTTRDKEFGESFQLYQAGIYDRQAVLERIDDPRIEQIMERLNEINILKAQLESMANENDQLKKAVNTAQNRSQAESGNGNVGIFNSN